MTEPNWSSLHHAYGPAVDTPELIRALRSPDADEAISELYSSITHQGTRYPATAAAVPMLVDATFDPSVVVRPDVLGLLEFCAVGNFGDTLDWRERRDRQEQEGPDAQRAWRAVHGERVRLRRLLDDADPAVHRAAVALLAWMGDADALRHAIARDVNVDVADERTACNAWLAACVLGALPPEVSPPTTVGPGSFLTGFGRSMAALRFAGASVAAEVVDLLVDVLDSIEADRALSTVELIAGDGAERYAALALRLAPPALHDHLTERLLPKIGRGLFGGQIPLEVYLSVAFGTAPSPTRLAIDDLTPAQRAALERLLPAIAGWDMTRQRPSTLTELAHHGLPDTPPALAEWLGADLPHPTGQRSRRPWRRRQ